MRSEMSMKLDLCHIGQKRSRIEEREVARTAPKCLQSYMQIFKTRGFQFRLIFMYLGPNNTKGATYE